MLPVDRLAGLRRPLPEREGTIAASFGARLELFWRSSTCGFMSSLLLPLVIEQIAQFLGVLLQLVEERLSGILLAAT